MPIVRPVLVLLVCLFLGQSSSLWAAVPRLDRLQPWGGQVGSAVRLTLTGNGLTNDVNLESTIPGTLTPLAPPREKTLIGKQLSFLLEINADAKVATYKLRAQSAEGLSNILLFTVGAFPEVAERENEVRERLAGTEPNDSLETAQAVVTPVIINGTLTAADQDFYRFRATRGQNFVLETETRRVGSAIDPTIELFDATGKSIGRNQDTFGIGLDSRLQFIAPTDGEYVVSVRDAKVSQQAQNYYRLKIADYTFVESLYPLGGRRGTILRVELFGGNLPEPVTTTVELEAQDPAAEFMNVEVPGTIGSLPLRIAIGDNPETYEPTSGSVHGLPEETWVNGRISRPNERDRYRLAVEPGQNWHIELQAAKLGTSRLYGVLNLLDGNGAVLGTTRDIGLRFKLSNLDIGENPNADQHMSFTVPDDIHEIQVEIEDLLGRSGPAYGYRLLAARRPGDFALTIESQELNVPLRGSALVAVKVNRLDYDGPIKLSVANLPDDWTMNGGNIPRIEEVGARQTISTGLLTLTPQPGAKLQSVDLEIWGEGKVKGNLIRRRARGPGIKSIARSRIGEVTSNRNVAPWLGSDLPAMVTRERGASVELIAPHYIQLVQGSKTKLPFEFTTRQGNVTRTSKLDRGSLRRTSGIKVATQIDIDKKNPHKGVFALGGQIGWGPGRFDIVMGADVSVEGTQETVFSQAITIDIIRPYEIEFSHEISTLRLGTETSLTARIDRQLGFDRDIEIQAENLPVGITCQSTKVVSSEEQFQLPCQVASTTKVGEYEIDFNTSSTVLQGKNKVIPFRPPPFKRKVIVLFSDEPRGQVIGTL